ncbi:MAG: hypothetical protein DI539_03030 [Flavobacterium psychrophilum]|nr:MAG: hypothetical protein DI539_03030 [Flavobacterium psychrophilum]
MQTKSTTDKKIKQASSFLLLTAFPAMLNPSKFGLLIIPSAVIMIYLAVKKYKEDKKAGIESSKYGLMIIILSVAIAGILFATISNYLISIGYYD